MMTNKAARMTVILWWLLFAVIGIGKPESAHGTGPDTATLTYMQMSSPPTAYPDLVLLGAWTVPAVLQPAEPFTLYVVIQNRGNDKAGSFVTGVEFDVDQEAVRTTFDEGLLPGQRAIIQLDGHVDHPLIAPIYIVLDVDQNVDEGPVGERNNCVPFLLTIDYPPVNAETLWQHGSAVVMSR